ncbi:MAG: efflux RND transporter periplasmic adaptor subunit [Lacipirellulaceae bacterium]
MLSFALFLGTGCDQTTKAPPKTSGATSPGPREVVALGRLQPAGGIISISAIPGEQVIEYAEGVQEGKTVEPGSRLASLSSDSLGEKQLEALRKKQEVTSKKHEYDKSAAMLQVQQAKASKAEAEAKLDEIAAQRIKLGGLEKAVEIAKLDVQLLSNLQQEDPELVTDHELKRKENEVARAESEYLSLSYSLNAAEKAANAAIKAAEESLKIAESNIEQLAGMNPADVVKLEIEVTEETLRKSELRAPGNPGDPPLTVLKKHVDEGEFITQLPVLQVADLSQMVCIAEVYEGDRTQIKEGQRVVIRSASFGKEFKDGLEGKVDLISSMIGNPELTNRNPLAPSDRSVVDVRIVLDPKVEDEAKKKQLLEAMTAEAADRIGLQVTVEFQALEQNEKTASTETKDETESEESKSDESKNTAVS